MMMVVTICYSLQEDVVADGSVRALYFNQYSQAVLLEWEHG